MEAIEIVLGLIILGLTGVNIYFIFQCKEEFKGTKILIAWSFAIGATLMYSLDDCEGTTLTSFINSASGLGASLYTLKFKGLFKEKQPLFEKTLIVLAVLQGLGVLGSFAN